MRKIISWVLIFCFSFSQTSFAQIATELNLSGYLSRMHSGLNIDKFRPEHLRYFNYDLATHDFKVLLDRGDLKNTQAKEFKDSTQTLLNYFLVGVALHNESFWVNLRPDTEDEIIDPYLAQTDVGKIMLEADLQLKKDTARLTSPETPEGREYWNRLYKKAEELFGYDNVNIPTLTRPWIVPGEIIIHETDSSAYIYKATLRVMLEQDYLKSTEYRAQSLVEYSFKDPRLKALNDYSTQLIRELIIPKLTKEVNSSKRYANIRQVYYSLILSRWFKDRYRGQNGGYASRINTLNLSGLTSQEPWSKTTYFKEYQKSFQEGEYNIQEPVYTPTGQVIRSYFSGGMALQNINTGNGLAGARQILPKTGELMGGNAYNTEFISSPTVAAGSPITVHDILSDPIIKAFKKYNEIVLSSEPRPSAQLRLLKEVGNALKERSLAAVTENDVLREPIVKAFERYNEIVRRSETRSLRLPSAQWTLLEKIIAIKADTGSKASSSISSINEDEVLDLLSRQKTLVVAMPDDEAISVYNFDKKKGGYVVKSVDKRGLEKLIATDEVGLIEDEDNPGQYIWAQKVDGGIVTKNGDLLISTRLSFPTMQDVPVNKINLPKYNKVVPLAYNFFKAYLGKDEYAWISDILAKAKVILVAPGTLGARHFSADKASKSIKIEKDFMEYLLVGGTKRVLGKAVFAEGAAGQKRVGMGLFAEAAIAISDEKIDTVKAKETINKIARVSLTGNNRLEDAIYLFNLKKEIERDERKLTAQERRYFLIDMMQRNRGFNGRRAAKILRETFGYYGEITAEEAEADLRAIARAHPQEVIIDKFDPTKEKEEEKVEKYKDRTDSFRLSGRHLADLDLIKEQRIVLDYEVDAPDAPILGGKVAYTGMMQWAPHQVTLAMFATAGVCFKEDLIAYNRYKKEFDAIAKELEDGMETLTKNFRQGFINEERFTQEQALLTKKTADKFQAKLDWGIAQINPELVREIKNALNLLAKRTGGSVFQLILAVRSSAIGEDSETASFAGRQDTTLFVTPLIKEFEKMGLKPQDYGYTWEQLSKSVFPWYDILNKAQAKLGDRVVTDEMLEVFIKEWLSNQRSLFNKRSIEYRLEKNIPVFTEDVEMSTIYQVQANTEYGYVSFTVNRSTGYPEIEIGITEGQTNPLVEGTGTGDAVFVGYDEIDPFRTLQVPESRNVMHVPNIFGKVLELEGGISKGGIVSIEFPEELKGKPAVTDIELLTQIGQADAELSKFFGMFADIEGGLIIRRDEKGNILFIEDLSEPDGIAKDKFARPRMQIIKFQTQIRPETKFNFKDPDVIEQHWNELPDEEYQRAVREGKVLYSECAAKTRGAAKGEVFIVHKDRPETWYRALKKIMVTLQSDPDMNAIMRAALAIVAAVGGKNSHTMIVAIEDGLIAISGTGDINKFYNGQKVTIDATRGVILEGDDYKLVPAGNDYNARLLGILPKGFSLGLNVNSAQLSQKGSPFGNKPDFYGPGLIRLELLLELMKGAGEGFLRYDSYRIYNLLEKLDKGELSASERRLLGKILEYKGSIKHLNAGLENNSITLTVDGRRIYSRGLEFYWAHVNNPNYPKYRPEISAERNLIKEFGDITQGYILGEERYIDILSRGIRSIVRPLMVEPIELLVMAQSINNSEVRHKAIEISDEYCKTYAEEKDALPTDEIIKQVENLISSSKSVISAQEREKLELMQRQLSKAFYIRLDDRKSDEYANVLGSMVLVDRNPMLGRRGIELMNANPEVTRMQLEAIKKVVDIGSRRNAEGKFVGTGKYRIRIFAPIVYDAEQVIKMNKLCDEVGLTSDRVQRGIMTETPQSVELRSILNYIDFTSTGGNDLLQGMKIFDRQMFLKYFESISSRSVESLRALATIANETKKWNREMRIPSGLKPVTAGYCGNWPADDPAGAIVLYIYGFDSASITIQSMDRTTNDLYNLLDHLYGHDELGLLKAPEDRDVVAKDLYELIKDVNKQRGLPENLIKMLPFLKLALDQRHFNIYDQIDYAAEPEIRTAYSKGSVSLFHVNLPFHYRLLEEYDMGEEGALFITEPHTVLHENIVKLTEQLRLQESVFNQLKEIAEKGEDVGKEISEQAAKINETNEAIRLAEYKLKSIEIKKMIEGFLTAAGYDINQPEVGKKFYVDNLKQFRRQQAKEAKERGEQFIIETAKEPSDYLKIKLGGDRYELIKEPNPDIGNRAMKKNLNPDENIFAWDLQAMQELRSEGLDNIALALSMVREVSEIDDTAKLLKKAGLRDIPLGLVINSPNLIYAYDYYLNEDRGISFLLLDREAKRELGETKRITEWDNVNVELINDEQVNKALAEVTIPVTKTAAAKYNKVFYLTEKPTNEIQDIYRMNKIISRDIKAYSNFSWGFGDFIQALKNLKDRAKGALSIRANLLLENAGSLSTLKRIKGENPNFKVAVWAEDQAELNRTTSLIGSQSDIVSLGLDSVLDELKLGHIPLTHIVIVASKEDMETVSKKLETKKELKAITVSMPKPDKAMINSMPLVFARAIADIFKIEEAVLTSYKDMLQNHVETGQISVGDSVRLRNFAFQVTEMPLAKEATASSAVQAPVSVSSPVLKTFRTRDGFVYQQEVPTEDELAIRRARTHRDLKPFIGHADPALDRAARKKLEEINKESDSSPINTGGIDFRSLPMTIKPMGSFEGLNLMLPKLSSSALASFNLAEEIQHLNQMASRGIEPSGVRVQELVAAAWQKGKLEDYQTEILTLFAEICKLQERECRESSEEFKVALLAANSI